MIVFTFEIVMKPSQTLVVDISPTVNMYHIFNDILNCISFYWLRYLHRQYLNKIICITVYGVSDKWTLENRVFQDSKLRILFL